MTTLTIRDTVRKHFKKCPKKGWDQETLIEYFSAEYTIPQIRSALNQLSLEGDLERSGYKGHYVYRSTNGHVELSNNPADTIDELLDALAAAEPALRRAAAILRAVGTTG